MSRSFGWLALILVLTASSEAAAPPGVGRDRYGDPLPLGAVARCGTARLRPGECRTFALSPDGKTLATGEYGLVRLWDARTGREHRTIDVSATYWNSLRFTPNGRHLVLHADTLPLLGRPPHSEDLLAVLDLGNDRVTQMVDTEVAGYAQVSVSKDGTRVVALRRGSEERAVVWDLGSGKELFRVKDATAIACSPDGKVLATGDHEGSVKLWRLPGGKRIQVFDGHELPVRHLAFSPDGKALASADSMDSLPVVLGKEKPSARLWDLGKARQRHVWVLGADLAGELGSYASLSNLGLRFSPDSKVLSVHAPADRLRLYDVRSGKVSAQVGTGEGTTRAAAAFSSDSRRLAWSGSDGTVRLLDVRSGRTCARWPGRAFELTFSPDGRELWGSHLGPWEVPSGRPLLRFEAHRAGVEEVAFTANGRQVISRDSGSELRLWSRLNGTPLPLPEGDVRTLAWRATADGRSVSALGEDGVVRVWELPSRRLARSLSVMTPTSAKRRPWDRPRSSEDDVGVTFDEGGARVAVADAGAVRVWDLTTGRVLRLDAPVTWRSRLAFSPDGRSLAAQTAERRVRLWSVPEGKSQTDEACLNLDIRPFSPHGDRLAFQSGQDTSRVLDRRGRPLDEWKTGAKVSFWSFLRDGEVMLASVQDKGAVLLSVRNAAALRVVPNTAGVNGIPRHDFTGRVLLTVPRDHKNSRYHVLDPYSGRSLADLDGWDGRLALSRDGRVLAVSSGLEVTIRETLTGAVIGKLPNGHRGEITALAFSPDGDVLATGGADTSVLLWPWRQTCVATDATDAETCWKRLADADAHVAWREMGELARKGEVAFLARKLRSMSDDERIFRRLLKALDDDDFDVRLAAKQKLDGLGAEALPWVYAALGDGPSLEVKRSLSAWLNDPRSQQFTPEVRRRLRAVWVLERIGTLEARTLLRRLEGTGGPDPKREARAAAERLASTGR